MNAILDWGVGVILWLQQFSPGLDLPFKLLTQLGEIPVFLVLLLALYWCLDRRTGARVIVLMLVSSWVNTLAKILIDQPRPFAYDSSVKQLSEAHGGGLPSGHTQGPTVVWGYLAAVYRRRWLWILAGLLLILTPLSRVYLGVHFPTDLLGGYLIGLVLVLLALRWIPVLERWIQRQGMPWQLGAAIALPILMMVLLPDEDSISAASTLMGFGVGLILERRWIRFGTEGAWTTRVLRFLLGVAVTAGLFYGLRAAFDGLEPATLLRFIRHLLTGLFGAAAAPWAFVRLGLAEREAES